jgi:hypothetical protein
MISGYILFCSMIALKVTFLNCVTGASQKTAESLRKSMRGRAREGAAGVAPVLT